ncbi:type II toxin-antitoxin system HicB family antitoxin [candidate division TA06 bacterium]|uniref:Type II toxin-antitoxin system HicB family antitoxin n=1 Tax=candidate division TA06 bacterium TaxID=2250710 RepID=A0A933IA20_UNCT6|nr:type II toxin-antitoxin system HicB family antitoxin [candidate division TA06 bacterium]
MRRFLVIIEKAGSNYSAYCPDLPGCIATGKTVAETECNIHQAIELHIKGIIEDRQKVPKATALSEYMAVAL